MSFSFFPHMTALTCRRVFPGLHRSGADSADVSLYKFTSVLLAEALEKLSLRGVLVKIVINEKKSRPLATD
ncbi:hypothetical protein Pvag_pPag20002 (plasmid) [Pantoea vagans C9-1]|nr:hypothetical protein Pvag_pPag20002 [Pantoea vagans C9-1]